MRVRLLFASAVAGALWFAMPTMQGQTNRSVPDHEKAKQELTEKQGH
jgi:hypothetical protein